MVLKPLPWTWMTWWYVPWLGEMEWTVGVEQAAVTKTKSCWLLELHCGEATHWETDLETRREPEDEGRRLHQ